MTTPKKPLSKTESAIQLGNQMMGARGGGTRAGLMKKFKKLLKIGEKQNKISSSSKIKEVRTRPVKALQNQTTSKVGHGEPLPKKQANKLGKKYPTIEAINKIGPSKNKVAGSPANKNVGSKKLKRLQEKRLNPKGKK